MKRAVIYTRISKDLREGAGVERQQDACSRHARTHGYELVETYSDNDISAFSGKTRPAYQRMLESAQNGRFDVIVTWHTDRLYRRLSDLADLLDVCTTNGIEVETIQGGDLDLSTASGRMIAGILGTIAAGEVDHQIERQKAAHADRAARGRYRGGPVTFGFRTVPGKPGHLVHDEAEAKALRYAADAVLEGKTLQSISRRWVEMGVVARGEGQPVRAVHVRRRLLHSRIAGIETYKGEEYPATTYEPIISEEKWRAVKAILEDPSRLVHNGQERRYLLVGIAKCGRCGAGLKTLKRGKTPDDKTRSYICPVCMKISRRMQPVDELVEEVVLAYLDAPENHIKIAQRGQGGADLQKLLDEQAALRGRQAELSRMFVDGDVTAEQLRSGTARLDGKLKAVSSKIAAASDSSPLAALVLEGDNLRDRWKQLDVNQRAQVIDELLKITILPVEKRGKFDPTKIKMEWK